MHLRKFAWLTAALLLLVFTQAGCSNSSSGGDSTTYYTVTFYRNATADDTTTYTQKIAANTATALTPYATIKKNDTSWALDDYAFDSWNTAQDGTGTEYANIEKVTLTADLTLYAIWKSNTSFTVEFLEGDSDLTATYNASAATITVTPPNSSETYTYSWFLNDVDVSNYASDTTLTLSSDVATAANLTDGTSYGLTITAEQTSSVPNGTSAPIYTAFCTVTYSE